MNTDQTNDFIARLNDMSNLYVEVKEAIVLAENFDATSEVYISPINELRNALDHIMRCLVNGGENIQNELDEAKEHMYRAGYDAYEVLAINVGTSIVKVIEEFDPTIISTVFPRYYTDINPMLIDAKVELAETRAHKKLNPESGTKSFTPYKEKISNLIHQLKVCNEHVPQLMALREKIKEDERKAIEADKKAEKKRDKKNVVIGLLVGIVASVVSVWVYDTFLKKEPQKQEQTTIRPPAKKDSINK